LLNRRTGRRAVWQHLREARGEGARVRVLSVDLGTSNTVAVLAAHGLEPRVVEVDGAATMPSAVYADEEGVILVGRDAERQARMDPTRFEPNPKRRIDDGALLLGGSVVPVTDLLAAVLRRVLDETVRQLGGAMPDEFRLTYPARWGSPRQNTLLSAARLAGMTGDIVLVPEPVAAAAHFAAHPGRQVSSLAVYDLGAGTFDVAVISVAPQGFTVLASDGLADLGGTDMDQLLLEYVGRQISNRDAAKWQQLLRPESTADRRARRALGEDVRAAKEMLSRHPQTEVPMPEPFADVLVTRPELEALVRPSLSRSVEVMSATLAAAGVQSPNGIYLVGGASRMPLVSTLITERLRIVPTSLDQPETAVALGAHLVPRNGVAYRAPSTAQSAPFQPAAGQSATAQQPASQPFPRQSPEQSAGAQQSPASQPFPQQPPLAQQSPASQPFPQQPALAQQSPASQPFPQQPALAQQSFQQHASQPFPQQSPEQSAAAQQTSPQPQSYPATGDFLAAAQFPQIPSAPARKGASKATMVALGAIVVVALLVLGGFLIFGQNRLPSAADCTGQPGSPDDKGFTSCTRQLAGPVADRGDCHGGYDGSGVTVPGLAGSAVTCHTSGQTVVYLQATSLDEVNRKVAAMMDAYPGSTKVKASWKGNGLSGDYEALAPSGVGVVVFTVSDRPLVGVLTAPATSDPTSLTAAKAAGAFERSVQPGT
jgi:actin-like ATPase involved in cell morphogenesis